MDIFLLRHGEAGKTIPVNARDRERDLTAAGKEEMRKIGEAMAGLGFEFEIVATSPLKRASETASIVNKALGRRTGVEEWPELSPEHEREALYRRLARLKPTLSVLCVGHEPYLTTAIGEMIGQGGDGSAGFRVALKKGGMAKVAVSGFSPRINGELRWLLTPRQIRKMG